MSSVRVYEQGMDYLLCQGRATPMISAQREFKNHDMEYTPEGLRGYVDYLLGILGDNPDRATKVAAMRLLKATLPEADRLTAQDLYEDILFRLALESL